MNKIWPGMIIIAVVLSIWNGNLQELITSLMSSTQSALETVLDMLGMMCMWSGFMKIAEASGIVKSLSNKVTPLVHFLFSELPKNNEATGHIAMNMTANILGLGNVATPLGIKAMESLEKYNLSLVSTNGKGVISVTKDSFVIGKKKDKVDGVIDGNPAVSRVHCEIKVQGEKIWIKDNGSANGTYVNDKKLSAGQYVSINVNDRIRIANEEYIVRR